MNEGSASSAQRLRYESGHWARAMNEQQALEQYLRLGNKVYNRTKFAIFADLAGDVSGKRILDYGGGAGITAIPYAKAGRGSSLSMPKRTRSALGCSCSNGRSTSQCCTT